MDYCFAFRVDAGAAYGWGHLMRCLALAQELRRLGARVVWICRHNADGPIGYLVWHGYEVFALPRPLSGDQDAELTVAALGQAGITPDWLIVDHYELDREWEIVVRKAAERVMVIDDIPGRQHRCDVLLDQTAPINDRLHSEDSITLSGPGYALVRPEFRALRAGALERRKRRRAKLQRLLISFGAADHLNMTCMALAATVQSGFRGVVHVVLGQVAAHRMEVYRQAQEMQAEVHIYSGVDQLAPLLIQADLAIGGGGMSAWERCALGIPSLVVSTAENQGRAIHALQNAGAVDYIGRADEVHAQVIADRIAHFSRHPEELTSMAFRAAALCDGLGAQRVALHLIPIAARDGTVVTLRPATAADCDLIYAWQRLPGTRRYARNPDVPEYQEHQRWFAERLSDPGCVFHIVEYAGRSVGVVRLDLAEEPSTYEVSIFIDPAVQRRGVASAALACIRRVMRSAVLMAYVQPDNTASRRLFERAGYVFDPDREMFIHDPGVEGSEST